MSLLSFVLGSFPLIITQYANYAKEQDLQLTLSELERDSSLPRIQTWNYIVVGGGSAGCIMASRLSEKFSVLLLESGGDPVPATYTPYLDDVINDNEVKFNPAINNIFYSQPQKYFSLQSGGIFINSGGRMLGGSGSHNDNLYTRGSPGDYENIAQLLNDSSWTYANVLKYFKKMENYVGGLINEGEREEYYGRGGPINVILADNPPRLLPHWLQAGQELGFKIADSNAHQSPSSFTPLPLSVLNGEKGSSYVSYIKPIQGRRKTLTVLKYSEVQKVLVDDTLTAYGVTYLRHGIPQIAHASRSIILSAGAISSPLLLIKSGVGPRAVLEAAKIPMKVDLPGVGQNLRDHCGVFLTFNANNASVHHNLLLPTLTEDNVLSELGKFQHHHHPRSGVFATSLNMGQAYIVSSVAQADSEGDWADMQFRFSQIRSPPGSNRALEGQDFRIGVSLNRQKSVGQVGFNASEWLDSRGQSPDTLLALVDNRFLTEESDILALIEGIKLALKVVEETEPFRAIGAEYVQPIPPPCKALTYRSDPYWECFIKETTAYWAHAVGTAKMGSESDAMAVTDSKFRVRGGVTNLKIVDASVFPRTPNTNVNSAVMMAAEKAADEILNGLQLSPIPMEGWPGNTVL